MVRANVPWQQAPLPSAEYFGVISPGLQIRQPPDPSFGYIIRTVANPTSIFGSFLVADASSRARQIPAQLRF
jgi:hypothetical protein